MTLACSAGTNKEVCLFDKGPCIKRIDSTEVTFYAEPLPVQAFKETTFTVLIRGREVLPEELILDLSMPGMYMGKNQVLLKKARTKNNEEASYRGQGVIPRCPTGKTLWQAIIPIPGKGIVAFQFHVKY